MAVLGYYFEVAKETYNEWSNDKAPRLGAALAYYTAFSIAPLILLLVAVVGIFFGTEAAEGQVYSQVLGLVGPTGAKAIQDLVASSRNESSGIIATVLGIVALFLGTTGVVSQIQDALDSVWEVEPDHPETILGSIIRRWISFSIVIAFGFILVVSLFASAVLQALSKGLLDQFPITTIAVEAANFILSLAVLTAFFSLLFRYVSNVHLSWRDVFVGAVVTAVMLVIGKSLLGIYLGRAAFSSTYGAAGAFVIVLVWVYYSAQIFLFGAELVQVLVRRNSKVASPKRGFKFSNERAWLNSSQLNKKLV